jgi:tripartite-type tricarboxylate transporter receptor subunit TctC
MALVLRCILLAFALAATTPASAQTWPTRPIHVVIGFPPGGGIDLVARILSPKLQELLGQPIIVDNRPGANGIVGMEVVAKAPGDGYTFFFGTSGNFCVNPTFVPNLTFNVDRDFVPVSEVVSTPFLLYVNPSLPVHTLAEFVAYVKARPGKVNYSSSGSGGAPHLTTELLNQAAGLKTVHIPYKGSAPAMADLIGGQVQYQFDAVAIGLQQVKAGKLKALATTGATRLEVLPDVPRANETLPGFVVVNWYGMVAPAGTSRDIVVRFQQALAKAMQDPEIRAKLTALATDPVGSTPEALAALIRSDTTLWTGVIKSANIQPE